MTQVVDSKKLVPVASSGVHLNQSVKEFIGGVVAGTSFLIFDRGSMI